MIREEGKNKFNQQGEILVGYEEYSLGLPTLPVTSCATLAVCLPSLTWFLPHLDGVTIEST